MRGPSCTVSPSRTGREPGSTRRWARQGRRSHGTGKHSSLRAGCTHCTGPRLILVPVVPLVPGVPWVPRVQPPQCAPIRDDVRNQRNYPSFRSLSPVAGRGFLFRGGVEIMAPAWRALSQFEHKSEGFALRSARFMGPNSVRQEYGTGCIAAIAQSESTVSRLGPCRVNARVDTSMGSGTITT